MRSLFRSLTVIFLLFSAAALIATTRTLVSPEGTAQLSTANLLNRANPSAASRGAAGFPLDRAKSVVFEADELTMSQLTPRERRDQLLDWLLLTVVRSEEPRAEALNQILADLPVSRQGYMKPFGVLEFGRTRSRYVKDGIVVAVIPAGATSLVLKDYLGQIADEHRKNQGGAFKIIRPYEYDIAANDGAAKLTRRADVTYAALMSPEYGYYSATVSDRASLASFLGKIDDLTQFKTIPEGLELGGRKVLARPYHGISIEHIATLWQAEKAVKETRDEWEALKQRENEALELRWSYRTYRTQSEKWRLERERDADYEAAALRLRSEREKRKIFEHSGFSLDPFYDYTSIASELQGYSSLTGDLDLKAALEGLAQHNIVPLLRLQEGLRSEPRKKAILQSAIISNVLKQNQFQAARYDGPLNGTEVGMILFYTDLLAKLWVLNYEDSAPSRAVPDFLSGLDVPLSISYKTEAERYPEARLWFGTSNLGWQTGNDQVLYRRNATRIYSAGSNPLEPGKEVLTSMALGKPIDWWNDHYEEVEWIEPQYQRLNQILKWSIAINWLLQHQQNQLSFLASEQVRHDLWFPDWARQQADLRFKNWTSINFLPKGAKGTSTEALPMLESASFISFGEKGHIEGGVSLARPAEIVKKAFVPQDFLPVIRRSNIDYTVSSLRNGIKTLDGVSYDFQTVGKKAVTKIKVADDTQLRGTYSQLKNAAVDREITSSADGISIAAQLDGKQLGRLDIAVSENGFSVVWHAQDLETSTHFAQSNLSKASSADRVTFLRTSPDVEAAYRLAEDKFLVKLSGTRRWSLMEVEAKPAPSLAEGADARTGAIDSGNSIQIRLIDQSEAARLGAKAESLRPAPLHLQFDDRVSRFEKAFSENNYTAEADQLASDPALLQKDAISSRLASELQAVHQFVKAKDVNRALARLDELADTFGPTPEIKLTKALLEIDLGRPKLAADAINEMDYIPLRGSNAFLDEINFRLKQPGLSDAQRSNLNNLGGIGRIRNDNSLAGQFGDRWKVKAFTKDEKIDLAFEVDAAPHGDSLGLQALLSKQATIYVQDSPVFSNIDWNAPLDQVISKIPSGAKVLVYDEKSLSSYRPAKVFAVDENGEKTYTRVKGETNWNGAGAQSANSVLNQPSNSCPNSSDPSCPKVLPFNPPVLVVVPAEAAL